MNFSIFVREYLFCGYSIRLCKKEHNSIVIDFCKEIGTADADNLGSQLVVNPHKELCGAFVNIINLTLVNYTEQNRVDTERRQIKTVELFIS